MAPAQPAHSPLERAVGRVGERWTLLVVDALMPGPRKFGELADALPTIAPNVLTKRIRQLEQAGLVLAVPYSRRPVRMVYELTASGRELAGALGVLASWGARHDGVDDPHRHGACGGPTELVRWCPTCEVVVGNDPHDDAVWV